MSSSIVCEFVIGDIPLSLSTNICWKCRSQYYHDKVFINLQLCQFDLILIVGGQRGLKYVVSTVCQTLLTYINVQYVLLGVTRI